MIDTISDIKEIYPVLFNNSPFHISLFDLNGNLVESNSTIITKLSDYTNINFKGKHFIEIANHFENAKQIKKLLLNRFQNLREGRILKPVDFFLLTKERNKIWLRWNSTIIEIKNQKFVQVIIQDITEQKDAEEKLKESEEMYRLITENANDLIRVLNKNFEIEYANENAHLNVLGYSQEDLLGRPAISLNHPDDYTSIRRYMRTVFKTGEGTHESRVRHKNGEWIWFEIKFKVFYDAKGNIKYLNLSRNIEEWKQNELKLKESEEKYRLISENVNDLISVFDDKFNFEYINENIHRDLMGYTSSDLIGKKGIILIHPDDQMKVLQEFKKLFEEGKGLVEARIKHKNGYHIWTETKGKSFIDKEGNQKVLLITRDMSEHKQAEQKLKEFEERFRNIFESIPIGMHLYELDKNGDLIFVGANPTADKILNIDNKKFINKTIEEAFPPLIETDIPNRYKQLAKEGGVWNWDQVDYKDNEIQGAYEVVAFQTSPNYMVTSFADITERSLYEKRIKESEEKFRTITEQSFMGIIIIQDGKLKYVNKALSQISGYSLEEISNWTRKQLIEKIHPDDLDNIIRRLQRNIEGTMSQLSRNTFRIFNKDNEVRWLEDYTSKILFQGKPANLISLVDVTDKKNAEKLIIEENKRLLELHELRKDLITRVSHELKTPMTSIYGAFQILFKLYMDEIGQDAQKYIKIGHRGSLRLKQLIDNLLDVSRLDSKKLILHPQNENIVDLIVDCVKDMKYLATTRQQSIKIDLPNEKIIEIDRLRFRQVLSNLISNAIKNTPKMGKIFINLTDNDDFLDIQIRDTGVGLTNEEKNKLFEKFGKIERYGMNLDVDIEGSGLGLYISKEIVDLHGGEIIIESAGRNKGATFTVRLFKNKKLDLP